MLVDAPGTPYALPVKVVVTGGTGFVGKALVRRLEARGDEVTVFSRRGPSGAASSPRVRTVSWNPSASLPASSPASASERVPARGGWVDALDGVDAVIHLAGAGLFDERWTEERLAEVRRSRVEPTDALARAMVERCPTAVLVSASAVGMYGMRKDDLVLDEESPHGSDVLATMCEAWEAAADPARATGMRVVHPRIGIVFGHGGGALEKMLPAFRAFVGGPIGDGRQWLSWIHLDDVVSSLVFLCEEASCSGVYNATSPNPTTMNELASAMGEVMHRPTLFRVPSAALKLAMGGGRADALLTGQRVVPKRLLAAGFAFEYPALRAALEAVLR